MNDFSNLSIPRTTKATIKLIFFRLVDVLIVGGLLFLGNYIQQIVHMPMKLYFMFQGLNIVTGILCCLPSQYNPQKRTIQILIQLLLKDSREYHAGSYIRKAVDYGKDTKR